MLNLHEPLLVNLLGHTAGTMIFGIFLWLLLRDRGPRLPALAAALALLWNATSLLVFAFRKENWVEQVVVVIAYASLSLLPAVLLHLFAGDRLRIAVRAGYVVSLLAIALHASEPLVNNAQIHRTALILTSVVFAALAIAASVRTVHRGAVRFIGAMGLFLLSLSVAHFDYPATHDYWQLELLVHHASIPIALFVLLQDYRFVMADAFIRFLANIVLAGGFTWAAAAIVSWSGWLYKTNWILGEIATALLILFVFLLLFAFTRQWAQSLLTRLVFRRPDLAAATERLHHAHSHDLDSYLESVRGEMARYAQASARWGEVPEADLTVPVRVSPDEVRHLSLGRRHGGRRYLSEDIAGLGQLASCAEAQIERIREAEFRHLVSEAELRALHSQIHPHFLFNALNTLYGVIPREARGARQMVLNLADIFRYFLNSETRLIALSEEMRIVQAYLEIELLRLGDKLQIDIQVDRAAEDMSIPVLTIQPLVENAIKHGVAVRPEGGTVRVRASADADGLTVSVADSGPGFGKPAESTGAGVALENVQRRLLLLYGQAAALEIKRVDGFTVVGFRVPAGRLALAGP